MLASSIRAYVSILPATFSDGVRLYFAYVVAAFGRVLAPADPRSVGLRVPGRRNLRVSVHGVCFEVRPRTNDLDLVSPKHEPLTTRWFRVHPGDIVVDVGAHIGRYALSAARNASKVVAVEPDPSNFRLLERNVSLNGLSNVVLIPKALSSVAGTRSLALAGKENTGTSRVLSGESAARRAAASSGVVSVETETLDQLVDAIGLGRIDWLKIDVEGHEIAVLQGGESALRITRWLALEVTDATKDVCRRILESAGFGIDSVEKGNPTSNWLMSKRP